MLYDKELIESYEKHKHLFTVSEEIGMPWQTVYWRLKRLGIQVTGDKERWGSVKDKFAAKGELLFSSLVLCKNNNDNQFQSKVDFIVNGYFVDVKCSKKNKSNKKFTSERWMFSLKKQIESADFYVLFAYDANGDELLKTFLIPRDLISSIQTISISCNAKSKWSAFEVEKETLNDFFYNLPSKKTNKQ